MGRCMVALLAALVLVTPAAYGQQFGGQPGATMGSAVAGGPSELYGDVRLLLTVRRLALIDEQLQRVGTLAGEVAQQRASYQELRGSLYEENQEHFSTVIDAWVRGEEAPARDKRAADEAIEDLRSARSRLTQTIDDAADTLFDDLSDDQRANIESPEAAARRAAREQRMGGTESVGQFVLAELDAVRDLMPDEYRMLAQAEAWRLAEAIAGPDAPDVERVASTILNILDTVRGWSPDRYEQQRGRLPEQIEDALGIESATEALVAWSDVRELVGSERAPLVVDELLGDAGGEGQ